MKILSYIIKKFNYDIKMCVPVEAIEQKMRITGTFLEDKKYIDLDFIIEANNTKNQDLFKINIEYRLELDKEQENINQELIKKITEKFYPKIEKFLINFYQKEAGLDDLMPPKF